MFPRLVWSTTVLGSAAAGAAVLLAALVPAAWVAGFEPAGLVDDALALAVLSCAAADPAPISSRPATITIALRIFVPSWGGRAGGGSGHARGDAV